MREFFSVIFNIYKRIYVIYSYVINYNKGNIKYVIFYLKIRLLLILFYLDNLKEKLFFVGDFF